MTLLALLVTGVMIQQLPALATNDPQLEHTFPRDGGSAQTTAASQIVATYDRGLGPARSTFTLQDVNGADVAGEVSLTGPDDAAGLPRAIAFTPAAPLTEASSHYKALVHACPYLAGDCRDDIFSFAIDNTAPGVPVITEPTDGGLEDAQIATVEGTAEPGAYIKVNDKDQDKEIATGRATWDGSFVVDLPYPSEDSTPHDLQMFAIDEAGNFSAGVSRSFWHDSVKQIPVISAPLDGSSTNHTTVTVAGTSEPTMVFSTSNGDVTRTVTVEILENGNPIATTTADSNGRWTKDITFAAGSHTITARSNDGHSIDGPSTPVTFTVDLTAPNAPVIQTPLEGASLNSQDVVVAGTSEPNATIKLRDGPVLRATTQSSAGGQWAKTLTFTDGAHTVTATAVDAATNESAPSTRNFIVDTVAPAPPTITTPAEGTYLNTSTITVAGAGEAGASISVTQGSATLGSVVASPSGTWSMILTFADGSHTITATAKDPAGNVGPPSDPRSFTIDTVSPGIVTINAPQQNANFTDNSVVVAGIAEPFARVKVFEGLTLVGQTFASSGGDFSVTITFPNGVHTITARAVDAAGNQGPSSAGITFGVNTSSDTTPPATPVISSPAQNSIQPKLVVFRGTAEQGTNVRLYSGSALLGSDNASNATWSIGVSFSTEGQHTVFARAVDDAGNVSADSAPLTITIDATPPDVTLDQADPGVFVPPAEPVLLSGGATDDRGVAGVEIEVDDKLTNQAVLRGVNASCDGCPGTSATWTSSPNLSPGAYTVRVYAVDRAGNRSKPGQITILVL